MKSSFPRVSLCLITQQICFRQALSGHLVLQQSRASALQCTVNIPELQQGQQLNQMPVTWRRFSLLPSATVNCNSQYRASLLFHVAGLKRFVAISTSRSKLLSISRTPQRACTQSHLLHSSGMSHLGCHAWLRTQTRHMDCLPAQSYMSIIEQVSNSNSGDDLVCLLVSCDSRIYKTVRCDPLS